MSLLEDIMVKTLNGALSAKRTIDEAAKPLDQAIANRANPDRVEQATVRPGEMLVEPAGERLQDPDTGGPVSMGEVYYRNSDPINQNDQLVTLRTETDQGVASVVEDVWGGETTRHEGAPRVRGDMVAIDEQWVTTADQPGNLGYASVGDEVRLTGAQLQEAPESWDGTITGLIEAGGPARRVRDPATEVTTEEVRAQRWQATVRASQPVTAYAGVTAAGAAQRATEEQTPAPDLPDVDRLPRHVGEAGTDALRDQF